MNDCLFKYIIPLGIPHMNVDWTPIFVLPNVELLNPIECDIVAARPRP